MFKLWQVLKLFHESPCNTVGGNGVGLFTILIVFEDDVIKLLYWSLILKVNV